MQRGWSRHTLVKNIAQAHSPRNEGNEVEQKCRNGEWLLFACERHEACEGASFVELGAQVIVFFSAD